MGGCASPASAATERTSSFRSVTVRRVRIREYSVG